MKFLIYIIFYSMWYAEHVMNHEYLQTDGIGGKSEQCSRFSALLKPSTHSHHRQWEYNYTHTVPPFLFTWIFITTRFWISLHFCTDDMHMTSRQWKKYYLSLFMAIYLIELHSIVVLQWVFVSQWFILNHWEWTLEVFGSHLQSKRIK